MIMIGRSNERDTVVLDQPPHMDTGISRFQRATTMITKGALMVQNLQLLGFVADDAPHSRTVRMSERDAAPTQLQSNMLDRPNEKLLLQILHFLIARIASPATVQVRLERLWHVLVLRSVTRVWYP